MINDWRNKSVLVTGAGTGVGKHLSMDLAQRGAIVYATARSMEKCQPVADWVNADPRVKANGGQAIAKPLEVGNWEEFKIALNEVVEEQGKLDCLINNAGIIYVGEYYDMNEEFIKQLIHVNFSSVATGSLYAYRIMKEQGYGTIVNVSSMGGFLPTSSMVLYSATKHALVGLTSGLASEAEAFGVDIKAMCLGYIESEMPAKAKTATGTNADAEIREMLPMKAMATDKAATRLINGIASKGRFIFVPWYAKLMYYIQRYIPGVMYSGAIDSMKKFREISQRKQG